ncbi:hypothetical protein [Streptomyces himalayensis]|uniref:Uncharacterized protein n=1 Tax=Streptomyces himalayensis subsp. himalayensis TaxID=2756131 RepID=A0A7W0I8I0_9ACTN|nr:hypothetical protein [Streptomyces himalayensis]MBA2946337.1 hypothetical protein [Streptomyces himalayensis subsp. himalayensis]
MEAFERARLDSYFARIAGQFTLLERPAAFLITHLLRGVARSAIGPVRTEVVIAVGGVVALLLGKASWRGAARRRTRLVTLPLPDCH